MRIVLVADTFPPLRTSGAVQLRDLVRVLCRQGHEVTVLLPAADLDRPWKIEHFDGVQVVRLRAPRTKEIGYVRRAAGELIMPFCMLRRLRESPVRMRRWDGVIWYSPSIFLGPLAKTLMKESGCKGYLIVRDIFPEWALDMGLMTRGLPYQFFRAVAKYQYSVANTIGVQTPGNEVYFERWRSKPGRVLEVLPNWLDRPARVQCTIRINQTPLAGRKIFVYAGNMGVAQGMEILIELADRMQVREDVGFVFVGRGSDAVHLRSSAQSRQLTNTLFCDEIDPDQIADLYSQCIAGLVALDPRHRSHNIPGKFLTYMQSGLPVLANVNSGNDLAALVRVEHVGHVCETNNVADLHALAEQLLSDIEEDSGLPARCQRLFERHFSAESAATQIVSALAA